MSTELTTLQKVNAVAATAESIVSVFNMTRTIRRQELIRLREETQAAIYLCRARGYSRIVQASLEELFAAQQYLEQHKFSPEMMPLAMQQVEILASMLKDNVRAYQNSY